MPSNNLTDYNNLKIDTLETHMLKWAQYYNSDELMDKDSRKVVGDIVRIQRIILYKAGLGAPYNTKYVLVFESPQIKEQYKEILSDHPEIKEIFSDHQKILLKLIECDGGPIFLDNDFFNDIYIKQPKDNPIEEWQFRYISLDKGLQIPEIIPESKIILYEKLAENSLDDFVSNLSISYENDHEIKIQEARKPTKIYTCQSLGFRSNTTHAWKSLLMILEDPEHVFSVGPPFTMSANIKQPNKEYDRNQKRLGEINKKLIGFLNKEFSLKLPSGYNLFEHAKDT